MTCPKCGGQLGPVEFGSVEVDRCANCGGLWFDILERDGLSAAAGSEAIDTGAPSRGAKHDAQAVVNCPRDGARMIRMVDAAQPHIWLESCPTCFGVFLDAGEFRDLKERTLLEWIAPRRRHRQP